MIQTLQKPSQPFVVISKFFVRKIVLTVFSCIDCIDLIALIAFKAARKGSRIMSLLYSQTSYDSFTVIIEHLEHIWYINLVFLLLTLRCIYLPGLESRFYHKFWKHFLKISCWTPFLIGLQAVSQYIWGKGRFLRLIVFFLEQP